MTLSNAELKFYAAFFTYIYSSLNTMQGSSHVVRFQNKTVSRSSFHFTYLTQVHALPQLHPILRYSRRMGIFRDKASYKWRH